MLCLHVWGTSVHKCGCALVPVCGRRKWTSDIFFNHSALYILSHGQPLNPQITNLANLAIHLVPRDVLSLHYEGKDLQMDHCSVGAD